jgi:hypothetical protein
MHEFGLNYSFWQGIAFFEIACIRWDSYINVLSFVVISEGHSLLSFQTFKLARASNCSILFGCWQTQLDEKSEVLVIVTIMVTHCLLEWDTIQTGTRILVPMRKLLLLSSGEKTAPWVTIEATVCSIMLLHMYQTIWCYSLQVITFRTECDISQTVIKQKST